MLPDFDPVLASQTSLDRHRAETGREKHFRRGREPLLLRHFGDSKAGTLVCKFRSNFRERTAKGLGGSGPWTSNGVAWPHCKQGLAR